MDVNSHNAVIRFGKYVGTLYTRLPLSYLRFLANCPVEGFKTPNVIDKPQMVPLNPEVPGPEVMGATPRELARAELERRGTAMPEIDITAHAIDRASVHCWDLYRRDRLPGRDGEPPEGLHSWLSRTALRAWQEAEGQDPYVWLHGVKYVFKTGEMVPILLTVIRGRDDSR